MSGSAAGVPFQEQVDALRRRLGTLLPSDRWTDTLGEVNNWGFAVAGAKKDSLLQSIGGALLEAMEEGRDVRHFQRRFAAIVAQEGWTYRGPIGWRARVIFETNLGQSREAGKWAQVAQAKRDGREFWLRYVATMDGATRPQHAAWNGTILPPGDPWWQTHAPKNGWGCRCTVMMVSPGLLRREGWQVSEGAPPVEWEERTVNAADGPQRVRVPKGIDTGFGHNPGQRPLDGVIKRPIGEHPLVTLQDMTNGRAASEPRILGRSSPVPAPPPPRPVAPDRILPADLPPEEYARRFLAEFGATLDRPVPFTDVTGGVTMIGDRMVRQASTGDLKVTKQGRAPTILLCADALRDPDEVWAALVVVEDKNERRRVRLIRRYLRWVSAPDRERAGFVVTELGPEGWQAITAYEPRSDARTADAMRRMLERQRVGILLYRREG